MIELKELKNEKDYLNKVSQTIENGLTLLNNTLYDCEKDLKSVSEYISDTFYEIDAEERAQQRLLLEKMQLDVVALADRKNLLEKQKKSAYFGRVDFKANDEVLGEKYYIGIANLASNESSLPLVLDWRAPLSSIYYDYECGDVDYVVNYGRVNTISGRMTLKRQYKVNYSALEYAFDSNLTIGDEILKQALGGNADTKMKTIVATIQKEQNKIIRSSESQSLLVQGVAGSGKTSIALHRVAYLLYKNKISAKDILIISPSSLFSDYISNVLPELGENNSPKMTFDEIARKELTSLVQFEPKSQMLEDILSGNKKRASEVEYKGGFEFFNNLKLFLNKIISIGFKAKDIKIGKKKIKAQDIQKLYNDNYKSHAPATRIEWIADYIVDQMELPKQTEKAIFVRIKRILFDMFEKTDILSIYSEFLSQIDLKFHKIKVGKNAYIGYEDLPAILYIKNFLLGVETYKEYKHIVIDEMQDYSPIVYDLFNIMFPATKTILGDIYQCFEKRLSHEYLKNLGKLIGNCKIFKLATSYRSTSQIATFAQGIIGLQKVKNFKRDGAPVLEINNNQNSATKIEKLLENWQKKYSTIAILTTDIESSKEIYAKLARSNKNIVLIDETCGTSSAKVSVMPVVFSKGLEFDGVIYIESKAKAPDFITKNIKYIACTRALHELAILN